MQIADFDPQIGQTTISGRTRKSLDGSVYTSSAQPALVLPTGYITSLDILVRMRSLRAKDFLNGSITFPWVLVSRSQFSFIPPKRQRPK